MTTKARRAIATAIKALQAVEAALPPESSPPPEPSGKARGGKARAAALSPERRREIAKKGAAARWGKK